MKITYLDKKKLIGKTFLVLGLIFLFLIVIYGILAYSFFGDWGSSGTFGDTFGALNVLFTAFVLLVSIATIYFTIQSSNEAGFDRQFSQFMSRIEKIQQSGSHESALNVVIDAAYMYFTHEEEETEPDEEYDEFLLGAAYWFIPYINLVSTTLELMTKHADTMEIRGYEAAFRTYFSDNELKAIATYSILSKQVEAASLCKNIDRVDLLRNHYASYSHGGEVEDLVEKAIIERFGEQEF
ncbi:hypothetical protein [Paenibacillus sp. J22TS3]|uniref:hypothetical protein n=1 Tax=Paenibacillus sp. J22TS3 TaxID=2807192 RepID=UPI001B1765BF|nr:hypothetical protein [Paenibacillus sp. J22TS3]GIP22565.1 hypothetical protein J22TS3_28400 [Paenibacillus sp. J22TS3]